MRTSCRLLAFLPAISSVLALTAPQTARCATLYLTKARATLTVEQTAVTPVYDAYFHVPISFQEQVPIVITVESSAMIDYRFLPLTGPNLLVAARMNAMPYAEIKWTAWVLIRGNGYGDAPDAVPIPTLDELPDSAKAWLVPTDCAQIDAEIVQETAAAVRDTITDLIVLSDEIHDYAFDLPFYFDHEPYSHDAVYAIQWGGSCVGHAHAAAALFRANGIPARTLLNIPTNGGVCDQHWIIDYLIPAYGWVRLEPNIPNGNMEHTKYKVITMALGPEHEFPVFLPWGLDCMWHSSDPSLGLYCPNWGVAHRCNLELYVDQPTETIQYAQELSKAVFDSYVGYWGHAMDAPNAAHMQSAYSFQLAAKDNFLSGDLTAYIAAMEEALSNYEAIETFPVETLYFEDFEGMTLPWMHGGDGDEWEIGVPTYGPTAAHSGSRCVGTDLDDTYENNADSWFALPTIDLTDLTYAQLSFWVWTWVEDGREEIADPLWLDISIDGETFEPLCSHMGGINDDPVIPAVGGWNNIVLDLTRFAGGPAQIRFRFSSNDAVVGPGCYVDDVEIRGRPADANPALPEETNPICMRLWSNYPNPAVGPTTFRYALSSEAPVRLAIYDTQGRIVRTLVDEVQDGGIHTVTWDTNDNVGDPTPSGVYVCRLRADGSTDSKKVVLIH